MRFTPSPTAQDGILGHKLVASRRGTSYQAEIALEGRWRNLRVRGRADGYDPQGNRLEEVKTYRGELATVRANRRALHWAQAKVYGSLLCEKLGLAEVNVALVYFNIGTQEETVLTELHSAVALREFFETHSERFLGWALQELEHRRARDAMLNSLSFPHPAFRAGQRELAEAVYRTAAGGRMLLAEAPTGIGKTVATLFPLLKAMPVQRLDKLFFLAAKTPGRRLALNSLELITKHSRSDRQARTGLAATPLRVVELIARDKACVHPAKACNGESCPLAKGFYDRLPHARQQAVEQGVTGREALHAVALSHDICPYYMAQDMVRWADVVVGDYNYYFDTSAMLHSMSVGNQWRTAVLVDEAHNLVERARKMYSAELDRSALYAAKKLASAPIRRSLNNLDRCWTEAIRDQDEVYCVYEAIPHKLRKALQEVCADFVNHQDSAEAPVDAQLLEFFFAVLHFTRLAEQFGSHSIFDVTLGGGAQGSGHPPRSTLALRNVIPGPFLRERFVDAQSVVLFSATLSPTHYYTGLLGLPEETVAVQVESPFRADQLSVQVARHISTRFPDRKNSLAPIAALVAGQCRARPGNYLVFLSSYDYLEQVADQLAAYDGGIDIWRQSRSMDEAARDAFLARFVEGGRGIGFVVLGGPFAEGIDLPGERLVGAFIATLGLPQINPVNEQVRARMQAAFGEGYDYAYLYPGLQKIVQAAGRVIRTTTDQAVLHLMDDRFTLAKVQKLLPAWWKLESYVGQEAERSSSTSLKKAR